MERAVHDLVAASGFNLTPKKGAEATSHTVEVAGSMYDLQTEYSESPLKIGAVRLASQSGLWVHPASVNAITSDEAAATATLRPRAIGPGERCRLQLHRG